MGKYQFLKKDTSESDDEYYFKKTNNNNLENSINYNSPANLKIIPNRKLSPINNNIKKMIKI